MNTNKIEMISLDKNVWQNIEANEAIVKLYCLEMRIPTDDELSKVKSKNN